MSDVRVNLLSIDSIDNDRAFRPRHECGNRQLFIFLLLFSLQEKKNEGQSLLFVLLFDDVCSVYLHDTSYNVSGT